MAEIFGLDFGTTNSLATVIQDGTPIALVDRDTTKPHPSVVWYRGTDTVVGAEARAHLDNIESSGADGFIRSPKMKLRQSSSLFVQGELREPVEVVAEVLRYLRADAAQPRGRGKPFELTKAVMTVPVDFEGRQRRALRDAARKAGIAVVQFVHEPAAALYGYLRRKADFREELGRLENRFVVVFDWGGGTLDLTLCRVVGGTLVQIASSGDTTIGGDVFDERLRNLIRDKFAREKGLDDLMRDERPGMGAKLLSQCEQAKIALSKENATEYPLIVRDYLRTTGPAANLLSVLTRRELENHVQPDVHKGLKLVDQLLEQARLDYSSIECCLPTGGMVNMPAIRNGLVERFGSRVAQLRDGDRIISEGAAWIAHDRTQLTLSKPIEVRVADGSYQGHYHVLVPTSFRLPVEGQTNAVTNQQFVCADPRNGVAVFEFAKPRDTHDPIPGSEREALGEVVLPVDPTAKPLLERLSCRISIDPDYIAHVELESANREAKATAEFHRLDFGLQLPLKTDSSGNQEQEPRSVRSSKRGQGSTIRGGPSVALRANVALFEDREDRRIVSGDLAYDLWPTMFDVRSTDVSERQREEQMYYRSCAYCGRTSYDIRNNGRNETCKENCGLSV